MSAERESAFFLPGILCALLVACCSGGEVIRDQSDGGAAGSSGGARGGGSPWVISPGPLAGGAGAGGGSDASAGFGGSAGSDGSGGSGGSGGGGGAAVGDCRLVLDGATGNEPDGQIPVCCSPTPSEKANIDEAFRLLNEHRMANGLPELAYEDALEEAIQGHCRHMAVHPFSGHDAPESSVVQPWTRAGLCGTHASAENLAGDRVLTPAAAMNGWKNSPEHNANMLDPSWTRVGIGQHQGHWGQLFD